MHLHQATPTAPAASDCTLRLYETKSADQTAPCIYIRRHQLHQLHQTALRKCVQDKTSKCRYAAAWAAQDYSMQKHQSALDSTIQSTGLQPYSCIMQLHKTASCGCTSLHSSSTVEADEGCRITAAGPTVNFL